MTWLVTGGAGYIGAHIVSAMHDAGESVVVVDDLSTGDATRIPDTPVVQGSILDGDLIDRVLRSHDVTGIVHVAAKKQVAESVERPLFYYHQNVEGLRVLLESAVGAGVESFLFSSSAAVYGAPDVDVIDERTACAPVNPYGTTKLVGERMVAEVAAVSGMRFANLRYFNVAGAGEPRLTDRGISNLVPIVFDRLSQQRPPIIYGDDYDTPDGTCIRDFVHVADIASAHVATAAALSHQRVASLTANVGRGEGISVREMVRTIRQVTETDQETWSEPVVAPRRAGDPAKVVASTATIEELLGWHARFGVADMVQSAWEGWLRHAG